ncbi:hypothetical protein L7F22_002747, partial [Adiantum nelumboides]|nr:hypothetical protein [Adiantum nelumboides]
MPYPRITKIKFNFFGIDLPPKDSSISSFKILLLAGFASPGSTSGLLPGMPPSDHSVLAKSCSLNLLLENPSRCQLFEKLALDHYLP